MSEVYASTFVDPEWAFRQAAKRKLTGYTHTLEGIRKAIDDLEALPKAPRLLVDVYGYRLRNDDVSRYLKCENGDVIMSVDLATRIATLYPEFRNVFEKWDPFPLQPICYGEPPRV